MNLSNEITIMSNNCFEINEINTIDIKASSDVILNLQETKLIPTGILLNLPEDYAIDVIPLPELELNTPLRVSRVPYLIPKENNLYELNIIMQNTSIKELISELVLLDFIWHQVAVEKKTYDTYQIDNSENKNGMYKINKDDTIAKISFYKKENIKIKSKVIKS